MSRWIRGHLRALADALDLLIGHPARTALAVLALAALYGLPALAGWWIENLDTARAQWARGHQVLIVLEPSADSGRTAAIERQLQRLSPADWRLIPREKALADLRQAPGLAKAVDGLARNPLPDIFVVTPGFDDPDLLAALADEARRWPGVAEVEVDTARALREARGWALLGQAGALAAAALALAVCAGSAAITAWLVRRPREILAQASLLGATRGWLLGPGVWQGLLVGAGASIIAAGGLFAAHRVLAPLVASFAGPHLAGVRLAPPSLTLIAVLLAGGTLLTAGSAWLAGRRRLPT